MEALERFSDLMLGPEDEVHLGEAALCVAAHARPDLDIDAELARLDRLADEGRSVHDVDALAGYLWGRCGFAGDRATYYDPANSYLDQVLERRRGIPISLAIVAIEVGRRLDVPLVGVAMPVHFLVRSATDPERFVDPFSGTVLDPAGCAALFQQLTGRPEFDRAWLAPVGAHAVCARLLANLKAIARQSQQRDALIWITRLRCLVPGVPDEERAELARLMA